ncbi:MAG: Asp23/Gls24 family envelope stress response protein [Chloroflexota bacterium]|nr:Asp23/Gls24 family envelope stress response protein [Chloroflexota bacterium]
MKDNSHNDPKSTSGASAEVRAGGSAVRGTVRIAPGVLIELIELTVEGIDGVAGLRSRRDKRSQTAMAGARTFDNGKIAVTVNGDQIDAAIAFAILRGTNVSEFSAEVQKRIGFAVGNMLGMTVRTVDVYIEEIIPGQAAT